MTVGAASDPAAPDRRAVNRGIAVLRLALLPIALIELPNRSDDLPFDLYPYLVAVLGLYALAVLVLAWRPGEPAPPPIVQAVLDLVLIAALVYASGGSESPLRFSFYVLPVIAALRLSPLLTATWTALALGAYLLVTIPHPDTRVPADASLVLEESLELIWVGAAAVMLSTLVGRRERTLAALAESRRELVRQALEAEAQERRRLAQVLHDDAIQNVLLARQEVTDLERGVKGAGPRARQALDETHRQLRDEVFAMHPVGLERAGPQAVLQHFADDAARRGGFQVRVSVDPELAQAGDELLYACARELLVNAAKHARASHVDVSLRRRPGGLALRIDDDGVGLAPRRLDQAPSGGHIGFASMSERVRAVGGEVDVDSRPGRGTTITVVLPRDR